MIGRLRSYECGEYGLREAVDEVAELRRVGRRRDEEQARLVQEANTLQLEAAELFQVMRVRSGIKLKKVHACGRQNFLSSLIQRSRSFL